MNQVGEMERDSIQRSSAQCSAAATRSHAKVIQPAAQHCNRSTARRRPVGAAGRRRLRRLPTRENRDVEIWIRYEDCIENKLENRLISLKNPARVGESGGSCLCICAHREGTNSTRHSADHPIPNILTRCDFKLYYDEEVLTPPDQPLFHLPPVLQMNGTLRFRAV
ncbi:hypothetical protein RP20_CCG027128 [Aedes albopictus]|nr:hypothetical protein RP20_CCG027128 [Aedes albopictus]